MHCYHKWFISCFVVGLNAHGWKKMMECIFYIFLICNSLKVDKTVYRQKTNFTLILKCRFSFILIHFQIKSHHLLKPVFFNFLATTNYLKNFLWFAKYLRFRKMGNTFFSFLDQFQSFRTDINTYIVISVQPISLIIFYYWEAGKTLSTPVCVVEITINNTRQFSSFKCVIYRIKHFCSQCRFEV